MQKSVCYLATALWLVASFQGIQGVFFIHYLFIIILLMIFVTAAANHGEACTPAQDGCDATLNLVCDSTDNKCICIPRYWFDGSDQTCKPGIFSNNRSHLNLLCPLHGHLTSEFLSSYKVSTTKNSCFKTKFCISFYKTITEY